MLNNLLAVLRASEFWTLLGNIVIETMGMPVPVEYKAFGWGYVVVRIGSKLAKYVFPNPDRPDGKWFAKD